MNDKLAALAGYILQKSGPMEYIKLATIIYLADREHYLKEGSTISGARHIKREWGVDIEGLREAISG